MSDGKVVRVCQFYYEGVLASSDTLQMKEGYYELLYVPRFIMFNHLKWMCKKIMDGEIIGDKSHRWLGYIQGELRALEMYSVNELRSHLREE